MSVSYLLSSMFFGGFKYLISHGLSLGLLKLDDIEPTLLNLFLPTYLGAVASMALFYFASDFLMDRAAKKRLIAYQQAVDSGEKLKIKKKFTRMNKIMVKTKARFGIYAFTFLVPLFFSIPLGSILCAKFYGDQKKTYPLMILNMGIYGLVMSVIVIYING